MWLSSSLLLCFVGFSLSPPFSCISSCFISSIGSSFNSMSHFGRIFCAICPCCRQLSTVLLLNSGWERRLLFTESNVLFPCSDVFWTFACKTEWCWPKRIDEFGLVNFRYKNKNERNHGTYSGCLPFRNTKIRANISMQITVGLRVGMQNVNVIILKLNGLFIPLH